MIEFSFAVTVKFKDAQAFNEIELSAAHDRLNKRVFEALIEEFDARHGRVIVETEPT